MSEDIVEKVQSVIKEFIDQVGNNKIQDRNFEKIAGLYKDFLSEIDQQVKPVLKQNNNVKNKVSELKKKKAPKGETKLGKIGFLKNLIGEYISLFEQQKVLNDIVKPYNSLIQEIKVIMEWNKYEQWISWAIDFGEESYLATHIAKMTHSSSKGSSIDVRYHNSCDKYFPKYVSTPESVILDTAYPDNKYSSISQLYMIEVGGKFIGDLLRENGRKYLRTFTRDDDLLNKWDRKFSKNIKNNNKQSYFLSKQTYFPIEDNKYHLLLPLTSSSLAQELHLEHKKYLEKNGEQVKAREQRNDKKFSATVICSYPNKAYLNVTGSNHSNASSLNGKRGGRIPLLPTMPPQWKSNLASCIDKSDIFDKTLGFQLRSDIDELRQYLLLIKNKSLSVSEPKRNATVIRKLQAIISNFFNYVETINSYDHSGWSIDSRFPDEQQLLFEPWREDEAAKTVKKNTQWEKTLSQSFGRWLNNQLKQKSKLKLTPVQEALWSDVFLTDLREYIAVQEVKV